MARRFNRKKKEKKCKERALNMEARKKRTLRAKLANARKFVLNLSKYTLSNNEVLLLAKGLKFIPTPPYSNVKNLLMKDFDEFARKLRCRYLFDDGTHENLHPFRTNTGYKPPPTCNALENYIEKTKLELSSIPIKVQRDNLSSLEREALLSLKNKHQIVIKKADKSNTVVIMDRENYIREGLRQLNSKHYVEVSQPNIFDIQRIIKERVSAMHSKGTLDDETYRFLNNQTTTPKCGQLYLLPKIHKIKGTILSALTDGICNLRELPPGRPIISQCSAPTYKIGAYCDYFLVPIVQNQLTYIKDTTDFINKIESLCLPQNIILVTYDVTSMYTNMEFPELLSAVEEAYKTSIKPDKDLPYPDVSDLVFLIKTILENNYFEFNGKYYKQIIGCAMGCTVSPELSDIRMYQITQFIMTEFQHATKVLFHGRYRDDGFLIFNGSEKEILQFFEIGNRCHKHLKFTFEISCESANFLDTTVFKGKLFQDSQKLDIKSFIKPTNNFQYLHRESAHSQSVFKGFIKGECTRHLRNTNNQDNLISILQDFKENLLNRGYSDREITPTISETVSTNRKTALNKPKSETKKVPTVMVTKFNPYIKGLKRRIMKYWKDMQSDPKCKEIFKSEPIVAYSKHRNIGETIIRARLS